MRLALRLKEAEERADRLATHLLATNGQLEQAMQQRDYTPHQAQDVLIFAMAKMAELRGQETSGHLLRMQSYVRVLAEEAMRLPAFASADRRRLRAHAGALRAAARHRQGGHARPHPAQAGQARRRRSGSIMESHTVLGADILEAVARQHGACLAFLQMAIDIVRHHHERYDGSGYPDGLAGDAIPLAARIVAVADVYDAMRSQAGLQAGPVARRRPPADAQPDTGAVRPRPAGRLPPVRDRTSSRSSSRTPIERSPDGTLRVPHSKRARDDGQGPLPKDRKRTTFAGPYPSDPVLITAAKYAAGACGPPSRPLGQNRPCTLLPVVSGYGRSSRSRNSVSGSTPRQCHSVASRSGGDTGRSATRPPCSIAGSVDLAAAHAAAGQHAGVSRRPVIAARALVHRRRATELAGVDDQRLVQQTALVEILDQRANACSIAGTICL